MVDVTDPETKRKRIGNEFIAVFEEEAGKLGEIPWLAQGTLYPDVIESVSFKGPSAVIKTHHNVGGLTPDMKFKLIEPLRDLFKHEVMEVRCDPGTAHYLRRDAGDGLPARAAMTAGWARLPCDLIGRISSQIINEVKGVNRAVYDRSQIEWEEVEQRSAVLRSGRLGSQRRRLALGIAGVTVQQIDDWRHGHDAGARMAPLNGKGSKKWGGYPTVTGLTVLRSPEKASRCSEPSLAKEEQQR